MKNTDTILDELYLMEPELRAKDTELRIIVEKMLSNKPQAVVSQKFKDTLKEKIMSEIRDTIRIASYNKIRKANNSWRIFWYAIG